MSEAGPHAGRLAPVLRKLAKRRRPIGVALSLACHVLAVLALVSVKGEPPVTYEPRLMTLILAPPPEPPPPPPADPVPEKKVETPAPAKAPQRQTIARPTPKPPPPTVETIAAGKAKAPAAGVEMSESQIAGASTAGTGPPGGACNMPRLLQDALRKDRLVQNAVAVANKGKALSVWNGDWVRHPEQEGAGLAAVREAIMWEVGFAPEACRRQTVHGLVVLSLSDGPGAARLVVGTSQWRWTDLLFSRSGGAG